VSWEGPAAPYRIETARLVLRCYEPRDAALLKEAIDSSLDHLREFMPWSHRHPQPLEQMLELMKLFRSEFDTAENFTYGIFAADETEVLGSTGLHPRIGPRGLEVGYWVRPTATRQGIATETAAALTRVGFEVCGADRVELRIEPGNVASHGVPRKLGFVEEATLRRRLPAPEGEPLRDLTIWTMFREDFDPSLAPGIRAFDAHGERLI
jgi:RimJ/RimL family protein N-acetyltransferase